MSLSRGVISRQTFRSPMEGLDADYLTHSSAGLGESLKPTSPHVHVTSDLCHVRLSRLSPSKGKAWLDDGLSLRPSLGVDKIVVYPGRLGA